MVPHFVAADAVKFADLRRQKRVDDGAAGLAAAAGGGDIGVTAVAARTDETAKWRLNQRGEANSRAPVVAALGVRLQSEKRYSIGARDRLRWVRLWFG